MKFFADTADIAEIRALAETGLLDGVTTNPSLVHKSGRNFLEVVKEIAGVVSGPVSAEVVALDYDGMMREAAVLRKIAKNVDGQGAADARRPQGVQGADRRRRDGQRHSVLFGRPGAACGQGRRDLHLAVCRPARRHWPGRHGSLIADIRDDLRQLRFADRRSWSPASATRCMSSRRRSSAPT